MSKKPYYTVPEAAAKLGVVKQRVRQWILEGRIPVLPGIKPYVIEAQYVQRRPKSLKKFSPGMREQLSGPGGRVARGKKRASAGARLEARGARKKTTKKPKTAGE